MANNVTEKKRIRVGRRKATSSRDIPEQDEQAFVALTGDLTSKISTLSSSTMSLLVAIGQTVINEVMTGESVLVPLVQVRITSDDDENPIVLDRLIPLDNTAFLLQDLIFEFRKSCVQLSAIARGSLPVERRLISRVDDFLKDAEEQLSHCRKMLSIEIDAGRSTQ